MKSASVVVLAMIVIGFAAATSAEARGWGVGAGVMDGDFGFQGRKNFWLGGDISQVTAAASVYFHGKTTFRIDGDYHFVISAGDGRFYPLVGLQFAFNSDNVEFGLNVGGGVNFMFTQDIAAFGEVKYVIGDWDGWAITGGIYF